MGFALLPITNNLLCRIHKSLFHINIDETIFTGVLHKPNLKPKDGFIFNPIGQTLGMSHSALVDSLTDQCGLNIINQLQKPHRTNYYAASHYKKRPLTINTSCFIPF